MEPGTTHLQDADDISHALAPRAWRRWFADPGGAASLLLLAAVATSAVLGAWLTAEGLGAVSTRLVSLLAAVVACGIVWRSSGYFDMPANHRRGWRCVAAAMAAWAIAQVAVLGLEAVGLPATRVLATAGVVTHLLLLAALAWFLVAALRRGVQLRLCLDALILVLGLGAFLWVFEPARWLPDDPFGGGLEALAAWAPLAGALLLVVAALPLLQLDRTGPVPRLWLLAACCVVFAAYFGAAHPLALAGLRATSAIDLLAALACALAALGAHAEYVVLTADDSSRRRWLPQGPLEILPVAGLTLAMTGAVHQQLAALDEPLGALTIIACAVALLALARQSLVSQDLAAAGRDSARREAEDRFAALVRNSSDVILICGGNGGVRYATASAERVFGLPPEGLIERQVTELVAVEDRPRLQSMLRQALDRPGASATLELRVPRGPDRVRVIEAVGTNLVDEPAVGGCVLNIRDVTDRRTLEDQLKRLAFHDPLTLLANRALFRDRVEHALATGKRRQLRVAVIFVDLDNFKKINDSLGHGEGDRVLRNTANRLSKCTRTVDTVARLGGDEFAVLVEDASDEAQVEEVARRIVESLKEPFAFLDSSLRVAASVGIAFAEDGEGVEELMRNADVAMYQAKARGKSRYEVFRSEMQEEIRNRLRIEAELSRAIGRNELRVHYQPIVDLQSGYLLGVEALVRWQHPKRGLIAPAEFIGVAEESGQVIGLGRWVLHQACTEIRAWQDRMPRGKELRVAVNVSSQQLQSGDLLAEVKAALEASGLSAGSLVLEMTESVVMQDTEATFAKLSQLKRLGVRIAIDDFGTGYSSLSYLHRFPLDILKIDRSFVTRLGEERDGTELARAIVTLGETLGLEVVAEGIEFEHQLQGLLDIGCVAGQGYYWAKPALLKEIEFSHQARLRRKLLEKLPRELETSPTGRFRLPRLDAFELGLAATGSDER